MESWTVKNGRLDIHEIVVSEICRSEGVFTRDDVRERIAKRIQPYMRDFTPERNVEDCRNLNELLDYTIDSFLFGRRIRHVSETEFIFV